ncbi:molybdate ABC transporter substrate-binding protein [Demequina capsici]|uniref:Molybdate ABC transporter substrate-binding protein n=1 Tax=Demequina capsici TaxID=3075620 RepID=A0AA96F907_9MICO|nr:molybdate ABC transporter substrate-binding protein [Demequina sp. OYTSA14]WNM25459.1 molybdate ABC transporter substrate-binding protein [Demequina sp. OYTSA14]
MTRPRRPRAAASASLVLLAALSLSACTAADAGTEPTSGAAVAPQTVTVLAAASLTDVFTEIADDFEAAHPGVKVSLSFAGSSTLAEQVLEGAPADVLATANEATMAQVSDQIGTDPQIFATNTLTIAVPSGDPAGIGGLADLTRDDVRLVVCAPQVPCGAATQKVADAEGVTLSPVSEESNVTDVLGKVASGEADAGIVYVTDLARADGVEQVALDGADAAVNLYPITSLPGGDGSPTSLADAFVQAVLSDAGQAVLARAGFGAP